MKYLPRDGGISCSVLVIFCSSSAPRSTSTCCSVEIHSGGRVPLTMTAITWRRSLFSVFSTQNVHSGLSWKPGVINGTTKTTRCECRVKNSPAYVWSLTPAGMSSGKDIKVTFIRLMMSWIRSKWCLHASLACSITAQGCNSVSLLIDVMTSHVTRWRQLSFWSIKSNCPLLQNEFDTLTLSQHVWMKQLRICLHSCIEYSVCGVSQSTFTSVAILSMHNIYISYRC